jgi:dephospho-CoA kinase
MKRGLVLLGLTGSIGMGKSTAAAMLKALGLPVYDADAAVHHMLAANGQAVAAIEAAFPGTLVNGAISRPELGKRVFADKAALRRLEAIIHPRLRQTERRLLARAAASRKPIVVLDVPLLFETGGARRCDATITVWAPARVQARRVLGRPGMSPERLAQVRGHQMPDAEKLKRSTFAVPTGLGRRPTWRHLKAIVRRLKSPGAERQALFRAARRRARHKRQAGRPQ